MALASAWLAVAAVAADVPPTAVLEIAGDGFLAGRFAEHAAGDEAIATLSWRSPLFAEPVEFRVDSIKRVRFAPGPPPPVAAWRCELEGGDCVMGGIGGLDAEHLTFLPVDLGARAVRIRRSAVVRLTPVTGGAEVVVPGAMDRWRIVAGAWAAPGGWPMARDKGATAYRPLDAPRRACYDIALSWDVRPEFVVSVAAVEPPTRAGGRPQPSDSFRVECGGGAVVAVRERDRAAVATPASPPGPRKASDAESQAGGLAAVEQIAALAKDSRGLRMLVFVDRDRGRMAVILPGRDGVAGTPVFDATVPPHGDGAGGILVKLRSGDLRIDGLEVTQWRDAEPRVAVDAPARAESYDVATGEFTIRDAAGTRRLPAAQLAVLTIRDAAGPPPVPSPEALRATFRGGSRISGRIRAVATGGVVLASPALADDLECSCAALATLEPIQPREPPAVPGRLAMLEAAHGRLAGCPANPPGGDGLGWLSRGAVAAVRIPAGVEPLWITYPETKDKGTAAPVARAALPAMIYLRSGDAFPCAVLSGGAEGLRVRTAVAADVAVPAAALRAVELVASDSLGVPREKLVRLLTLPRKQEADPPTHVLRLNAGDYVRGKLVSLDDTRIRFDVLGTMKTFPRDAATRLIWLTKKGDPPAEAAAEGAGGVPVQGVAGAGRRLTVEARRVVGNQLVGRHPVLGEAGIDLATCDRLLVAAAIAAIPPDSLPYAQWVLVPSAVPRALDAAGGPAAVAGGGPEGPAAAPAPVSAADEQSAALAAAEQAAFAGDRGCLEPLGELLAAEAPHVRRRAIMLLRQLTGRSGRDLPFRVDEAVEKRQADVLRWRQWIAREGMFADLVVLRRPDTVAPGKPLGRTLCSIPSEHAVVEFDDQGRETFRAEAREAYACDLLPDGSRLVANGRSVVEYDTAGREVWSLPNLPRTPMSARRLDDGHTLLAFDGFDKGQVAEYDRAGEKVWGWEAGHGQMPADAIRLPDGGTLVALHGANRVIEIDESGTETWGFDVDDPLRVERLVDGTTLVVSGDERRGRIFDRDGAVVHDLGAVKDARASAAGILLLGHDGDLTARPAAGEAPPPRKLPDGVARFQSR
jgi:hypothetical protein